jgi:hypothetical protein
MRCWLEPLSAGSEAINQHGVARRAARAVGRRRGTDCGKGVRHIAI